MRKYQWLLLVSVALLVMAGIAMVSLAEYTKTGRCYRTGTTLSAEELRERAIRGFLSAQTERDAFLNGGKSRHQTFLIRKSLSPSEIIDAIASKSIVNLPNEAAYTLKTDYDISYVDSRFLLGEFSVVGYRTGGSVKITPSNSFRATDDTSARKVFEGMVSHKVGLSLFEKALGYGNHVFRIDYYSFIDLRCCEKRYGKVSESGNPPEWYARKNINEILNGENPRHYNLAVSNCGEVLQRTEDNGDDKRIFF